MKNSVSDNFLPAPLPIPPPEKCKFYFYCRLAFSEYRPKGVPRIFDAFLTQFWRMSDAFWNVPLFPIKQDPFWRISDAFLTHSCYCRRLFQKHLLDDTEYVVHAWCTLRSCVLVPWKSAWIYTLLSIVMVPSYLKYAIEKIRGGQTCNN